MMATMLPSAITPFYAMPRLNAPIALFRGRVDLDGEGATERHRGGIMLDWLPSPAAGHPSLLTLWPSRCRAASADDSHRKMTNEPGDAAALPADHVFRATLSEYVEADWRRSP